MGLIPRPDRTTPRAWRTLRELGDPANVREAPCLDAFYELFIALKSEAWLAAYVGWVTPTQGAILYVTAMTSSPLCISEIARTLLCSRPNVSRAVATLERKSLVMRRRDRHDKRRVLVYPNRAARRVAGWVLGWNRRLPDALAFTSSDDLERFADLLGSLKLSFDVVDRAAPRGPARGH